MDDAAELKRARKHREYLLVILLEATENKMVSLQTGPTWTGSSAASGFLLQIAASRGILKASGSVQAKANSGSVSREVSLKTTCCTLSNKKAPKTLLFLEFKTANRA